MRLVQELSGTEDAGDGQNVDIDAMLEHEEGDRAYAAMSLAKTIGTVCPRPTLQERQRRAT